MNKRLTTEKCEKFLRERRVRIIYLFKDCFRESIVLCKLDGKRNRRYSSNHEIYTFSK